MSTQEFFSDVKRMIKLYNEGKSARQVAEEIGKNYRERFVSQILKRVGVSHRRGIYWSGERNPRWNKPNLEPSPALAYLLGVYYGDASLDKNNHFRISVTKKAFAKSFAHAIQAIGLNPHPIKVYTRTTPANHLISMPTHTSTFYYTGIGSRALAEWLRAMTLDKAKDFLSTREMKRQFIRGVYESEGTSNATSNQIIFSNTNRKLLELCRVFLKELDYQGTNIIVVRKAKGYRKALHRLYFGRKKQFKRFYEEIKPVIKSKKEKGDN